MDIHWILDSRRSSRRTSSSGAGGTFLAWYCPKHPYRTGSYGLNAYTPAYDGGERLGQPPRVKGRWTSIYLKGGANAPIMLDCALWAGDPMPTDTPPQTEEQAATQPTMGSNSIRPFCIPRHGGKRKLIFMHREILQTPIRMETDHRDSNGLNNQRENLRTCTHAQNMHHQRPKKGTSKYKGVYWAKDHSKWCVKIRVETRRIHIGYFNSEIEAAKAYDFAARCYFGEFAYLNL